MTAEQKYGLIIRSLREAELKEICEKVREIEQRHPDETIFIMIEGLEKQSAKNAAEFIAKVFPLKRCKPTLGG
jgi:endonuclease V-like protein UPF0215 family